MQQHPEMSRIERLSKDALIQTEAVTPCEHHKDVLLHNANSEAERRAHLLASNWVRQEGILFIPEDVQDAIKSVLDRAVDDGCPECARHEDS